MNHVARMPGRFNDRSMALMGIPDLPESAFGGDLPPFQRTALVRMMGIKPQGGGGGGLMKLVAVVAAVAIPFAAPAIAASLATSMGVTAATFGLSATVGSVVGSAMVGAGLGAISAKVTGGDVGRGALMGAIGGGIGGYTSMPASASGSPSAYSLSPNTSGTSTGLSMPGTTTPSLAGSPSLGSNLSFTPSDYSITGGAAPATAGLNTAGSSEFGLKATTASAGGLGGAGTSAGTSAGTGAVAATAEKLTFAQALAKVPGAIADKFTDPKALADLTMRAGAQLITGQLSDAGLSNEEKQLLQARVEEMKANKETNNELFQTQLREAYDLLGRSDYFDPGYFGQQYAGAAKQRTSAQKEAALRKVNPRNKGSRAALERQYNLQSAREEATAYDKGSMYGFDAGLKLTQQALNALPKNAPSSSADATALSTAYSNIEERKRKSQEGLNKTLGGTLFT